MDFSIGQQIGSYRVVRRLGAGGMSAVYEVEHVSLGTHLALKAYTLNHGECELMREKFLAEGKILARIRHPRIVRVYDFGIEGDTPYFVMDLLIGSGGEPMSLEVVRSRGIIDEREVARWYADICEGLSAVHAAGVVHRDIKLENVLIGADGRAVLADFGISRVLRGNAIQVTSIQTIAAKTPDGKVVMGTANYLAPEIRGGAAATFASDFYSLGVLLFRFLTGVWYEPKTDVMNLLAPFDPRWKEIIAALVVEQPEDRRMQSFSASGRVCVSSAARHSRWVWLVFGLASAVALVAAMLVIRQITADTVDVPPNELFAAP